MYSSTLVPFKKTKAKLMNSSFRFMLCPFQLSGIAGFVKAAMTLSSGKSNDDNMDDSSTGQSKIVFCHG